MKQAAWEKDKINVYGNIGRFGAAGGSRGAHSGSNIPKQEQGVPDIRSIINTTTTWEGL